MSRCSFKSIVPLVAALSAIFSLSCLTENSTLERVRSKKTITIGYAVEAPYAFVTAKSGNVTGQSPEIAKYIAAKLGAEKIDWRQVEFDHLFDELKSGRIDVVAAGTFITKARSEKVAFSEPIFHVKQGLLVPRGNPRLLRSYKELAHRNEIKVAVLSGSVEQQMITQIGVETSRVAVVPDALTGRAAIENGNADCLALSSPTVHWMAINDQLGKTEMAQPFEEFESEEFKFTGFGAFAFRKSDLDLLSEWNSIQKSFIGSEEHIKLVAEFGFTVSELPGNITTAEVIQK